MDNKTGKTKNWSIYMVRNKKNDLYTGISIDVALRFEKHKSGKGAKFLKTKHPLSLVYQCQVESQSEALSFEYKIKKLKKIQKEQLVKDQPSDVVEYIKNLPRNPSTAQLGSE
jgi:putative endonuclease